MKVVFTDTSAAYLRSIADYLAANYPSAAAAVERRLEIVIARIARWPERAHG
jgi:plasmid stabilization system protein ParE